MTHRHLVVVGRYPVNDATVKVVDGSRTTPQDIEDFWTFTRPVGNNPWKLAAIQST
jgi:predicted lipid-binding transport protein (Tim44 family)